ncbi:AraC family transcriptional regulator [Chitinophaga agri]|uniref:AraC family transcriptional regulator n=1 Tax=Chitinophaga agri TaxID=2703787 RepID=A0A6B9ZEJ2_9BACT|nr:helix-turn-helix domain-containing protein [Chitinophaga agri]QHS59565.1 AraC family transcriptional regulator [Chitinophaga agri]
MQTTDAYITGHIPVPAEWEQVFAPFYYTLNQQASAVSKLLSPTFQTILVFNFGAPIQFSPADGHTLPIDKSIVIGPLKFAHAYTIPAHGEMLVANFKLDAFYRFFGKHLRSYADFLLHPDDIMGEHCFATLWEELKALPDMQQRVDCILDFSAGYLRSRDSGSEDIVNKSDAGGVVNPVKEIADKQGQSERNIQLKYKKYLGYSAKEMNRYQRFKKILDRLQELSQHNTIDWFELVHEGGYYDQSHLIHDFNHFLGLSPAQYLKLQSSVCIASGRA